MYFIAGITGHVGGAAARRLLELGHDVRSLVRDPQKATEWSERGVEIWPGDLGDSHALAAALKEVEGAFLMIPPTMTPLPGYPEAKAVIASYSEALRETPPPRVVFLSSVGSEQKSGLGLITSTALMEQSLGDLPIPTAFVRAGSFLENYAPSYGAAAASGVFYTFISPTSFAVPMVATVDIGNEVAKLLTGGWSGKKIVELGTTYTADDLAAAMSKSAGRQVKAQAVPRDRWASTLEGFGLPAGTTGAYEEMMDGQNSGWIHFGVQGTEAVSGTVKPEEFFQQVAQAN